MTRETDEASAEAWNDRMSALYGICEEVIIALERDNILAQTMPKNAAIEMLWTMLSIQNWEQLTIECGWSTKQYIAGMKTLVKRAFVDETKL